MPTPKPYLGVYDCGRCAWSTGSKPQFIFYVALEKLAHMKNVDVGSKFALRLYLWYGSTEVSEFIAKWHDYDPTNQRKKPFKTKELLEKEVYDFQAASKGGVYVLRNREMREDDKVYATRIRPMTKSKDAPVYHFDASKDKNKIKLDGTDTLLGLACNPACAPQQKVMREALCRLGEAYNEELVLHWQGTLNVCVHSQ